jgi:hypothetical protein
LLDLSLPNWFARPQLKIKSTAFSKKVVDNPLFGLVLFSTSDNFPTIQYIREIYFHDLLSRAGGGIWPDETQQPTVILSRDGALTFNAGTLSSTRHGANSSRNHFWQIRGEKNKSSSLFLMERGFYFSLPLL